MDCACQIDIDIDGSCDFMSQKIVKARKQHKCCECYRDIYPDEKYEYVSGVWEGNFDVYKTCIDCTSIRKALFCTYYFTELYEDLYNHLEDIDGIISEECMLMMTIPARIKVADMLDDYYERMEAWR